MRFVSLVFAPFCRICGNRVHVPPTEQIYFLQLSPQIFLFLEEEGGGRGDVAGVPFTYIRQKNA
jgi:hypothetical protein